MTNGEEGRKKDKALEGEQKYVVLINEMKEETRDWNKEGRKEKKCCSE